MECHEVQREVPNRVRVACVVVCCSFLVFFVGWGSVVVFVGLSGVSVCFVLLCISVGDESEKGLGNPSLSPLLHQGTTAELASLECLWFDRLLQQGWNVWARGRPLVYVCVERTGW